ncbi:MAG: excinuclease ABC subunit UvrA, partial [Victivallales bacterium]|nr:excinuclease ABC subunit UvrA [Victivallales bacterium]
PYVSGKKGELVDVLDTMRKDGFVRARIDGVLHSLDEDIKLAKNKRHTLEAVVDRLMTGNLDRGRLNDSVELALKRGGGIMVLLLDDGKGNWQEEIHSEHLACPDCHLSFGPLLPRNFSFNNPYGACPTCDGLGKHLIFLPETIVPDPNLSIKNGAIQHWRRGSRTQVMLCNHYLRCLAKQYDFSLTTAWKNLPERIQQILLYGSGEEIVNFDYWMKGKMHEWRRPFEGVIPNLLRRFRETDNEELRTRLQEVMSYEECPECHGKRLKPEYLAVTIDDLNIYDFCSLSIDQAMDVVKRLELAGNRAEIASGLLAEIRKRLGFLQDVGLNYLTLNRESGSLSGGEAQRIRLASQVGSGLVGVLYILDEPSIGLHQRDNDRLLNTLTKLRDVGNTVIVVEHDLDTMRAADYLVDLGPGAGENGGHLVCAGTPAQVAQCQNSVTGQFLRGARNIPVPAERLPGNGKFLEILGAKVHNLQTLAVKIPLGTFTCVTGVSGSGKSSLVNRILVRALLKHFGLETDA